MTEVTFEQIAINCPWAITYQQARCCSANTNSSSPKICVKENCAVNYWINIMNILKLPH